MEIVLNQINSEYLEIISLLDLDNMHKTFKNILTKLIFVLYAFTQSNRDTILSAKSLKINSDFIKKARD